MNAPLYIRLGVYMSVNLNQGEVFTLPDTMANGSIEMDLAWEALPAQGLMDRLMNHELDLDFSCLMIDSVGNMTDVVWFHQLRSLDGAIRHGGDKEGNNGRDGERIAVHLTQVSPLVKSLLFVVTSFSGHDLSRVHYLRCGLKAENQPLAHMNWEQFPKERSALILARLTRHEKGWRLRNLGVPAQGKTFLDLLPVIRDLP